MSRGGVALTFAVVGSLVFWRTWRGLLYRNSGAWICRPAGERGGALSTIVAWSLSMIPEPWRGFVNYCCGALPSRIQGVAVVVAGEFQR